ncbi:MAG: AI-2E family transporter, partial [Dehalococcoidia bacterium]|nr:AI-2E family transporter [Dehalococcoidia bacterium]
DAVAQTFSAVGLGALIFLLLLFMLAESRDWGRKLAGLPTTETDMGPHIEAFIHDVRQWLIITFGTGLMVAIPCTIALMLFDVDFAILWGILILVMSFVPSIGFIISVIPPVAVAWLLHGPAVAMAVLGTIVVINTVVDNFIKPRIVGRSLSISPLILVISVIFWAWVLGPLGAFLSTPLTILLRFALQTHPDTEWLARMMGPAPEDPPPPDLEPQAGEV